jgi:hypothetical protein
MDYMKKWVIYSLSDPRDGVVRYIGKTEDAKRRLMAHVNEAIVSKEENHRLHWIRKLIASSIELTMMILEEGVGDGWVEAEKKWIKHFRDSGVSLVNGTDGGDGLCNPSKETRDKISKSRLGKPRLPETREKIALNNRSSEKRKRMSNLFRGRPLSLETRAKISKSRLGMKLSPETREKLSKAHKGKKRPPRSEEWRARQSISQLGRVVSSETREKMSVSHKGKPLSSIGRESVAMANRSPEKRAKQSIAIRGRKHSHETCVKISNANRLRVISPETRAKMIASRYAFLQRKAQACIENL